MGDALQSLTPEKQTVVRQQVRDLLERTDTFQGLPAEERRGMANSLVNVVAYLADAKAGQEVPNAIAGDLPDNPVAIAQAKRRGGGGSSDGIVQNDFTGAAAREGAEVFKDLVNAVDFPEFVSGLIDGVFNSIVTASLRQMDAYAKLLESVVKSVNEFATDNFTLNQGRDWLTDRFPRHLSTSVEMGQPKLALTEYAEESGLDEVQNSLGMEQSIDLDTEESEQALAQRGQLEMARLRQKQLATMVVLGINRVVVTDGLINAKVMIDVRTKDKAKRDRRASDYDSKYSHTRSESGGWFSDDVTSRSGARTVVSSAMEETSQSSIDTKAKLSGEVRVNFKSETFPLEKLASQTQIDAVNQINTTGEG
ncbi:MAG: hypothetical protein KZQ95_02115 [Candidatus Thiodiazotropha sp. (ex Epidulcina cf. delphinae)]|nr:hypothetical protein [Candidatus Thiodiazotropha sp. (ex Epidulcina cf. delphinae)]